MRNTRIPKFIFCFNIFLIASLQTLSSAANDYSLPYEEAKSAYTIADKSNNQIVATSSLNASDYILGPGDLLNLKIFDDRTLSGRLEVLNDGSIPMPLIGPLNVSGLTLNQATILMEKLMSQYLLRPDLQLSVFRPRPIRVALIGEVERPGLYTLTNRETLGTTGSSRLAVSGLPTLVDAIQKAGGITQLAKLDSVVLQRKIPGDVPKYKQAKIDLIDLILEGNQIYNPYLFDGDIIRLPKASKPLDKAMEIAALNLSPKTITVNVIGEVEKVGKLVVDSNTPLVQAVLLAGGSHDWRANDGNIQLVRIHRDGSASLKRFKLDLSAGVSNENNPPLRHGDTIRVNRNMLAKTYDAIEAVVDPMSDILTALTLYNNLDETFNLRLNDNFVLYQREDDN